MAFPHPEAKPTGWAFPSHRPQPMIATNGSGCERSEPSPLEQPPSDGIPTRSTTSRRNGQLFPLTGNPPSNHSLRCNHPIAKAGESSIQKPSQFPSQNASEARIEPSPSKQGNGRSKKCDFLVPFFRRVEGGLLRRSSILDTATTGRYHACGRRRNAHAFGFASAWGRS